MFRVSRTSEQCEYDFEKRKFVAPLPLETQRVAKWSLEDRRISSDPKPIQQPSGGAKDSTSGSSKGDGAEEEDRSSARNGNAEKKARKKSLKEEEADELDDLDDLDEDYSEDDATPASGDGSQRGAPSTMSPPTAGPVLGAPKPAGCMQVPSTAGLDKNAAGQGSLSKSACAVDVSFLILFLGIRLLILKEIQIHVTQSFCGNDLTHAYCCTSFLYVYYSMRKKRWRIPSRACIGWTNSSRRRSGSE